MVGSQLTAILHHCYRSKPPVQNPLDFQLPNTGFFSPGFPLTNRTELL